MKIFFDMDGTLADLYGVPNWLPLLREENTGPYKTAQPMTEKDTLEVMKNLKSKGIVFEIISWGSKNSSEKFLSETTFAKKIWLQKNYPGIFTKCIVTPYGVPKSTSVSAKGNYLFDDNDSVGHDWELSGGIWIDVKSRSILKELKKLAAL